MTLSGSGPFPRSFSGVVIDDVWCPLPADWIVERERQRKPSEYRQGCTGPRATYGEIVVRRPGQSRLMTPAEAVALAELLTMPIRQAAA